MKTVRFILAAFYLLQTIVICFTCYFAVKAALIPLSAIVDPNDDSFGAGLSVGLDEILKPFEVALVIVFFLFFFIFSLVTSVLLLRNKKFVTACAFAASGTLAPIISALISCLRGDLSWGLVACAEVLLGLATIVVLMVGMRNQRRPVLSHA
jgi:hypothetical protein